MAPKLALAALMALPALSMGAVLPEVDTRAANIVGGSKASSGQFPYIVTLTTSDALCGAVLINSNTILTASHCTFDESGNEIAASAYTIRAGSLKYSSGGTTSKVSKIIRRSDYDASIANNDVAIMKLSTTLTKSSTIGWATLTSSGNDPSGSITVAGWGLTTENGNISSDLRYVSVPIVARDQCAADYANVQGTKVTDNMFCAGLDQGGKDACNGDSGGPVIGSDGTLVGVVSWGQGCAEPGYPGVYTRLGNYVDWIKSNI